MSLPWNTRCFWMRARRGWSPSDTWSFDTYLAQLIADAVDELRENSPSFHENAAEWIPVTPEMRDAYHLRHPDAVAPHDGEIAWEQVLLDISNGFRSYLKAHDDMNPIDGRPEEYWRAMALFAEFFNGLWK
jgi:hypothetical protein